MEFWSSSTRRGGDSGIHVRAPLSFESRTAVLTYLSVISCNGRTITLRFRLQTVAQSRLKVVKVAQMRDRTFYSTQSNLCRCA